MKLLHRTTRDFLVTTTIIMTITGFGLYMLLQKEVQDEMNEQLSLQADMITEQLKIGKPVNYPFSNISPANEPITGKPVFGDTLLFDRVQQKYEDYHYLKIIEPVNGKYYKIQVMTAHIGWEHYYQTIFYILLVAIILLAVSGVLITYFSTRKIWRPFFLNLERVKKHSVSTSTPLQLYESPITEFKELQRTLTEVTDRGHREYMALREFTENASHEIQTPLGIIQSKLDRLSQMEVNEEMAKNIVQAKSAVERLTRMSKNLLLLAKLDNQAFDDMQEVSIQQILGQHLNLMEELFTAKLLHINSNINQVTVNADPYLCEVFISNLFSNVLMYTEKSGKVNIVLQSGELLISNEGRPLDFPADQLFNRFKKSPQHVQSNGLGLAIVKQICMIYGWKIHYQYDNKHIFRIYF